VLRLSLHPAGLAPRIANLAEWRAHLLSRLRHQIDVTNDPVLIRLLRELREYPAPEDGSVEVDPIAVIVPFKLIIDGSVLSFFSTTTVFGTPVDITLSELALEAFYPADVQTADALRSLAG
jgi:hypothetical protein